jgi:hypothetical protein
MPHGLNMELGLVFNHETGQFVKSPAYKAVKLNGWNHELAKRLQGGQLIATSEPPPGVTDVDEEFITAWLKKNAELSFVKNKLITIVKPNDVTAASKDLRQVPSGVEPLDPNKAPKGISSVPKEDRS